MTDHRTGNGAMIPLARLWAKTSQSSGKVYLTGRLGAARVLIFENRDRASDDDPTHIAFIAPGPDQAPQGQRETRPQGRASASHGAPDRSGAPSAPPQPSAPQRTPSTPGGGTHGRVAAGLPTAGSCPPGGGRHVRPFDDDLSVLA